MPYQFWSADGLDYINVALQIDISAVRWWLHLYKNDITPDEDTVLGDFTEADFPGYAAVDMGLPSDSAGSGYSLMQFAAQLFTCSGGGSDQTVYGYYVTNPSFTVLRYSQRGDEPVQMFFVDDMYRVVPTVRFQSIPAP